MAHAFDRRSFLKVAGLAGVVFSSRLARAAAGDGGMQADEFYFAQLSDTHWGYQGPANPESRDTLPRAIAAVNALEPQPDFVVFTGDLTHTTDDAAERRRRMSEFRGLIGGLKVRDIRLIPGEHDAALDRGAAFREFFGETHYSFDHKGVHFIALDNVSDPAARIGEPQLAWLEKDLASQPRDARIALITHRPLFPLYPKWDWATRDGEQAIALLMPYRNVTVFYGHIHQENHFATGHIEHHAARSLIFPLPAPGSTPKRDPLPWDPAQPFRGLGFREIEAQAPAAYRLAEFPVAGKA